MARRAEAPRRESSTARLQRISALVLTALFWSIAAGVMAHSHRDGALAWVLAVLLNFFGDPLALVVARRAWYSSRATSWLRMPLSALAGVTVAMTLFVVVEQLVPTGGVVSTLAVLLVSALLAAREPRRSRAERMATRAAGLS